MDVKSRYAVDAPREKILKILTDNVEGQRARGVQKFWGIGGG